MTRILLAGGSGSLGRHVLPELKEAEREGVRKFGYVSLFKGDNLRFTEYAGAPERFVDALKKSSNYRKNCLKGWYCRCGLSIPGSMP